MIRTGSSAASDPSTGVGAAPARPVHVVVVGPDETVESVLARHPGATASFNKTLRVALAMRGGVSLAVWIGGAVAELDLLRRIRLYDDGPTTLALVPETPGTPLTEPVRIRLQAYAEMLDAAGFDRVEFDLLAGASAGGLNAVMYAVAQRAGTGLGGLLRTWGRVGGFWGLLHPPGAKGILALMRGEDYFRKNVFDALVGIYDDDDRHGDLVTEYAAVDLSATVIDASDEYEIDANEGRGHFRFVGDDDQPSGNRIPARRRRADGRELIELGADPCAPDRLDPVGRAVERREAAADEDVREAWEERRQDLVGLSRLALAARSTSSLPGGFEPALIRSIDGGDDTDDGDDRPGPGMRFAFAAHREDASHPYRIVDGAVFDNVPIERALRAARSRTSTRRADRVMLFLDPEPDPPIGGGIWNPHAGRFFSAIKAMYDRQLRRESVAREVAELERFNTDQQVAAARFRSSAPIVRSALADPAGAGPRREAYLAALGAELADHLAETIAAPSLWQLHSSLARRRRFRPIPLLRLTGLDDAAGRVVDALPSQHRDRLARSSLALADAANCVLGWTRALEAMPARTSSRQGPDFATVRTAAYDALTAAIDGRDRATAEVLERSDRFATEHDGAPSTTELGAWVASWLAEDRRWRLRELWDNLDRAVARLRIASVTIERELADGSRPSSPEWETSPWRPLAAAPILAAADLPPLYHSAGIPPALSNVRYWAIGVDEPPVNPRAYRTLVLDRWYAMLGRVLRTPGTTPKDAAELLSGPTATSALDRGSKLAGYGIGNFLGFLSREWRVNDWWWGRLDAAGGITRFFASITPGSTGTDATTHRLQDAVLAESDAIDLADEGLSPLEPAEAPVATDPTQRMPEDDAAGEDPGDARRARMRAGTDTIANLRPTYRFAIASRALRLVDRVAVQPIRTATRVLSWIALAFVRPLLVPLPTIADPPRLALISGFVAAVAWLLTWDDLTLQSTTWIIVAAISGLIAFGVIIAQVTTRLRAWTRVADELSGPLRANAEAARSRALLPVRVMTGVALASVFPFMIAIMGSNFLLMVLCLGVTVTLTMIAVRLASASSRAPVPHRRARAVLMIATFGLLGGVLPMVQFVIESTGGSPEVPNTWNRAVLSAGAAAVTIALTVDWLRIVYRPDRNTPCPDRPRWFERVNAVNWVTVTALSVAAGWLAHAGAAVATRGIAPLLADTIAATVFVIVWANVVWWMPDLVRRVPAMDDGVTRAPRA
ncbi:hypothetical protein GCM10009819_37600 [Agromyces tropicus]|uniref:PNPLA domain-containing protein n=1 Tax=Agromyces tropicus TaxID=555371 RepID=A0ABN2UZC4_9MICO